MTGRSEPGWDASSAAWSRPTGKTRSSRMSWPYTAARGRGAARRFQQACPLLPERVSPRWPFARRWARALAALPSRKFDAARITLEACGLLPAHGADQALVAHVEFVYGYYARLALLADASSRHRLHRSLALEGGEHLQRALGLGRGLVLVSAHLGEFDLAGSWLAEQAGCQVVAVVDPVADAARQRLFDSLRGRSGILLRRRDQISLADLEGDLGRGRAVLIMLDRAVPSVGLHGALLGRPARLSVAPAALARRASAPVLVASTTTNSIMERTVRFSAVSPAERASELLAGLADEVGRHIAACPWQWHIPAHLDQLPFTAGPASSHQEPPEDVGWRCVAETSVVNTSPHVQAGREPSGAAQADRLASPAGAHDMGDLRHNISLAHCRSVCSPTPRQRFSARYYRVRLLSPALV